MFLGFDFVFSFPDRFFAVVVTFWICCHVRYCIYDLLLFSGFLCIFDLLLCLVFLGNYLFEFLLYLDFALMFDFVFSFTVLFCCRVFVLLLCFCLVCFVLFILLAYFQVRQMC